MVVKGGVAAREGAVGCGKNIHEVKSGSSYEERKARDKVA